jgi:hypothetical protein
MLEMGGGHANADARVCGDYRIDLLARAGKKLVRPRLARDGKEGRGVDTPQGWPGG